MGGGGGGLGCTLKQFLLRNTFFFLEDYPPLNEQVVQLVRAYFSFSLISYRFSDLTILTCTHKSSFCFCICSNFILII